MNKIKKLFLLMFVCSLSLVFTGCGDKGSVVFYNFKPEVEKVWEDIAKDYTEKTGVEVKVATYSGGLYDSVLMTSLLSKNPPTLFQVSGDLDKTKFEYCYDLKDTKIYDLLSDKNLAAKDSEGHIVGIPYAVEGYGIIYNNYLLKLYFSLGQRQTIVNSIEDIDSFEKLKIVADDLQIHGKEIGIKGAFSSTSLSTGEEWRWGTHLFNYPLLYEFEEKNIVEPKVNELELKYFDYMKNIFDLYIKDSTTGTKDLDNIKVDDSIKEFATGKSMFLQNGNWAWEQLLNVDNRTILENQISMLPIYTGYNDEHYNGIAVGTESYFAVNKNSSKKDIKATLDFLEWLFSSEEGKKHVVNDLKFIAPMNTFTESDMPDNPLAKEVIRYINDGSKNNAKWVFQAIPNEDLKNYIGRQLYEYVVLGKSWDEIKSDILYRWNSIIKGESYFE